MAAMAARESALEQRALEAERAAREAEVRAGARQQALGQLLANLKKIAETYNIAVVCTNQVTANPDGSMFAATAKPIGGNVLGHAMTTRVQLKKGRDNARYGKVIQGPNLAEAQCQFCIVEAGIQNED